MSLFFGEVVELWGNRVCLLSLKDVWLEFLFILVSLPFLLLLLVFLLLLFILYSLLLASPLMPLTPCLLLFFLLPLEFLSRSLCCFS